MGGHVHEVLLVDPDRRVRTALRTLLTAAGFAVTAEARDAAEAWAAADRRPPGLAVVEPLLPNAAVGCSLIGALHHDLGVTVVGLTGDRRLRWPVLSAGAHHVLLKDCGPEELLAALHGALAVRA